MERSKETQPGTLVISLDFELYWGMQDKVSLAEYGERILGVHAVVPKLLALFEKYDVHATWAMVGMLGFDNEADLKTWLPKESRPQYRNESVSSYYYLETIDRLEEQYHFAPALVQQILATPGQELASHTFSHLYTLEAINLEEAFRADCKAQKQLFARYGVKPRSLVFPRNQVNEKVLQIAKEEGITTYRGTEDHWLYRARPEGEQTNLFLRASRLLDHYLPLSGFQTYAQPHGQLMNLPASRQLRPYNSRLRWLDWLRLWRITLGMTRAAKQGEVFHLWWHPHNFGIDQIENLAFLEKILQHYQKLQKRYDMQSQTMNELATHSV